ncbi:MAG TPA: hypothetical protein VNT79_03645, partial [Phycisphaerae bacterium]|nr:hypothetical protein [Phycisphaerae bacterium]
NTDPDSRCTDTSIDPNIETTFTQVGGRLTAESDGIDYTGGINTDGTFTIGAIVTPTAPDGSASGQGLVIIEGEFVGDRIIGIARTRLTGNNDDGSTIDLQAEFTLTLERVD